MYSAQTAGTGGSLGRHYVKHNDGNAHSSSLAEFYHKVIAGTGSPAYSLTSDRMYSAMLVTPFSLDDICNSYAPDICQDMGYLIRKLDIPNMQIGGGIMNTYSPTSGTIGKYAFSSNSSIIAGGPSADTIKISFLETEYSIADRLFLPWMELVGRWGGDWTSLWEYPKAKLVISVMDPLGEYACKTYTIRDIWPIFVSTPDFNMESAPKVKTREVQFAYNSLNVEYGERNVK